MQTLQNTLNSFFLYFFILSPSFFSLCLSEVIKEGIISHIFFLPDLWELVNDTYAKVTLKFIEFV